MSMFSVIGYFMISKFDTKVIKIHHLIDVN